MTLSNGALAMPGVMGFVRQDPLQRFWAKVGEETDSGCWPWVAKIGSDGYGKFYDGTRVVRAHRFAYELLVGPIPEGLQLDHLCRNPPCINPEHLEPVTHRENCLRGFSPPALAARATHCTNGHPYDATNTRIRSDGARQCITCFRAREARENEKAKAKRRARRLARESA